MNPERSLGIRALELASVAGFAAVAAALAIRLWSGPWDAPQLLRIGAGGALGYVVADLVSGIAHWFCDTFFQEDTPLIGRAFIHPFREHHTDPLAITRHGFFEVNGNNCLVILPPLAAVLLFGRSGAGEALPMPFIQGFALGFALATFATNQLHKWAHQPQPARMVRWLQASGLVLSPAHHALHHSLSYRQAFCITAGWLDPWIDRFRVFDRIERGVRGLQAWGSRRGGPRRAADAARRE